MQLIQTVLSKIYLHWYSVFILPKTLVKKVNSLLASFLRPGETKQMYGAKVRWKEACAPKQEGGLG